MMGEIQRENHCKNSEGLYVGGDVVNLFAGKLGVAGQDHSAIKEQLQRRFGLRNVRRQQVTLLDKLPGDNLADNFSGHQGKSRAHNERLKQGSFNCLH